MPEHARLQEAMAEGLLDQHYSRSEQPGGRVSFEQSDAQRTLMMLYALVAALQASESRLGPGMLASLRAALKLTMPRLQKLLRCECAAARPVLRVSGQQAQDHGTLHLHSSCALMHSWWAPACWAACEPP